MVATEIKHEYHDHNLRLTFSGEIKDDSQCDGCMRPISIPFYSCDQCMFSLHKACAELPREKRHPFHKHVLTLTNTAFFPEDGYSICYGCFNFYHGFSYRCYNEDCKFYSSWDIRYIRCVALRLTTWYKYDRDPLTLTYSDDSSPSQHYCDLCENERNPDDWFYSCADCDNSLHSICALGEPEFFKIGSKVKYANHSHPLSAVKNIWNCPPCKDPQFMKLGSKFESDRHPHPLTVVKIIWNCRHARYAVIFAMEWPCNVKNLNAALPSTMCAIGNTHIPLKSIEHRCCTSKVSTLHCVILA
ncbi:hypothetical protein F3Y22_tig00117048pilonHSYRG00194 [Hibiscus syriacus]|uniref:PHD-type domain-containing protein n=1 Tax=Hibiscus syriacus TaxID=106335 RepID=A0A6A2W9I8_HIBSY|nr:hypothetical protein F3Y22_tig00117048pilonHSYRG00194 [Hibiscus syriacus]